MNRKEIQEKVIELLKVLNNQIIVGHSSREEVSYKRFTDDGTDFGLDYRAYRQNYFDLLQFLFNLDSIGNFWSEESIRENIDRSLKSLANFKKDGENANIEKEAKDLLSNFDVDFEYQKCLIPIVGLSVERSLEIGEVALLNIEEAKTLVPDNPFSFFDDLDSHKNSIGECDIKAEWRLASRLASEKIEKVLNLLRFLGTLVWYDQPNRHIYLMGKDRSRFRYSLIIDSEGRISRTADTEFFILPYKIDSEFIKLSKALGYDFYKNLIVNKNSSPLEKSLSVALSWYGDATQDLNPLTSFIKYYISIEAVLKNPSENGKTVVPKRLSVILRQFDKKRQEELKKDMEDFIDERNSVIHSGETIKESPEYLSYLARIFSKQLIHQVRIIAEKERLNSKDELFDWVKEHYKKFF